MLVAEKLVCEERMPRWTYNRVTGQCVQSQYDGCFLTQNRFMTKDACENKCQFHIKVRKVDINLNKQRFRLQ